MERFASDVLNTFIPFAEDHDSAQAARDFLLPTVIDTCRAFYLQHLTRLSTMPGRAFGDLRAGFDQAFPGTNDRVERLQDQCVGDDSDKFISCIADVAALPMALSLFRKPLGDVRPVREIKVMGEPKRVVQDPPEYEVALLTSAASGDRSLRVRVRNDYGRLWLVPTDPEEAFMAAIRGDAATPFLGTWVHQIEHGDEQGSAYTGRAPGVRRGARSEDCHLSSSRCVFSSGRFDEVHPCVPVRRVPSPRRLRPRCRASRRRSRRRDR